MNGLEMFFWLKKKDVHKLLKSTFTVVQKKTCEHISVPTYSLWEMVLIRLYSDK